MTSAEMYPVGPANDAQPMDGWDVNISYLSSCPQACLRGIQYLASWGISSEGRQALPEGGYPSL